MAVTVRAMLMMIVILALTACGGDSSARSVDAYCTTMAKHRDQYLTAMSGTDDLAGLIGAVSAIGDLKNMWIELAKVAPPEIQTDTESVRDSWIKVEDAAISGDYRTLIGTALFNSAAIERVDQFMIDNCDTVSGSPQLPVANIHADAEGQAIWNLPDGATHTLISGEWSPLHRKEA